MRLSYRYLIDPIDTRHALRALTSADVIGLDTETYWVGEEGGAQLSLLQIATLEGQVLVIDALSAGIREARAFLESEALVKVAHNASFDHGALAAAGFIPQSMLDTMRLTRRNLKLESFSLASVAHYLLGVTVDKRLQKSNWLRRPLDREQLDYAALDAKLVLDVYQAMKSQLSEAGIFEGEHNRARLDWKKPLEVENGFVRPPTAIERKEALRRQRS